MGRKSTADLATLAVTEVLKPTPPPHLNSDQRDIWNKTVEHLPGNFFRPETFDLLAQYCRHVDYANYFARRVEQAIEEASDTDIKAFTRFHKSESDGATKIAQKLGMTTPNYERQNKKPGSGKKQLGL